MFQICELQLLTPPEATPMPPKRLLRDIAEKDLFALNLRIRDEQTRNQYRYALANFSESLGHPATIADLTDDSVARMMSYLRSSGLHPRTVNDRRCRIHALWNWLARRGVVTTWPTTPPLPVPKRSPRAWRRSELDRLTAAAQSITGEICGLPASTFWLAVIAIEWDTGMRAAELLALEWQWLDLDSGWLTVPAEARKGKSCDWAYGLSSDTMTLLRGFARARGRILNWSLDKSRFYQHWKTLLEAASLPANRYTKTQCLRRSFASWLKSSGEDATEALGHGSATVTKRAYLDPTICGRRFGERMPFRLLRDLPEKRD